MVQAFEYVLQWRLEIDREKPDHAAHVSNALTFILHCYTFQRFIVLSFMEYVVGKFNINRPLILSQPFHYYSFVSQLFFEYLQNSRKCQCVVVMSLHTVQLEIGQLTHGRM